ncbi:unnamed protein product, partial [Ectocarpus sp. 12 AP-2014]
MSVVVRPLQRDDKPHWSRLWHDYLAFYETEVPPEMYDLQFERLLSDYPHNFNGFVA